MNRTLQALYESTEEDILFAVGLIQLPGQSLTPYVHIHYPNWTHSQLAIVRNAFEDGLTLSVAAVSAGLGDIHLATCQRVTLRCDDGGQTSVLRGPAWSAQLEHIRADVVEAFALNRRRCGWCLVLLQTPAWQFTTTVLDAPQRALVGPIRPRTTPIPLGAGG